MALGVGMKTEDLVYDYHDEQSLIAIYERLVGMVEMGEYEAASEILNEMRGVETDADPLALIHLVRLLMSVRIAIKNGKSSSPLELLNNYYGVSPYFLAEIHFVRGLGCYQLGKFQQGIDEFIESRKYYESIYRHNRILLVNFNVFVGKKLLRLFPDPQSELIELRKLLREALVEKNRRMVGKIFREKSKLYQRIGRFQAAAREAYRSVDILEAYGPISDYQLSLVQAADCALDVGDKERASGFLELIAGSTDARVRFPRDFLWSKILGNKIDPSAYDVVTIYWREKWLATQNSKKATPQWIWTESAIVNNEGKEIAIVKQGSLEGQILRILLEGSCSKQLLVERLWPESCDAHVLDNRLHRLVSRTNKKTGDIITFDGSRYQLQVELVIR